MRRHRTAALLAAFALVFGMAGAAEGEAPLRSGDYTYVLRADGSAEITGYAGEEDESAHIYDYSEETYGGNGEFVLPAELDGHPVTRIGNEAFAEKLSAQTLVIPEGVEEIGEAAFSYCRVGGLSLPGSLRTIGREAFFNCRLSAPLALPEGLTTLGDAAFAGFFCGFRSVSLPASLETVGANPFADCYHVLEIEVAPGNPALEVEGNALSIGGRGG